VFGELDDSRNRQDVAGIDAIVNDARLGRPFVLIDAPDRENEGDLIIPADAATADQIAFMAREARGLICLAIDSDIAKRLRLAPMTAENRSGHGTAFTVSVEAREGVTTGISAHDRARTISVAIGANSAPDDLVSPGHVFPLVARNGGVLVRAGHTEAAVDIAKLAGLTPAGVICEIMNPDGTMARLPELIAFAHRHDLNVGTIEDLIAYRRRTERQVARLNSQQFKSDFGGTFTMMNYCNTVDGSRHVALVKGTINASFPTLVRMHRVMFAADVLGAAGARRHFIPRALKAIAAHEGAGVAVFISDERMASSSVSTEEQVADHGPHRLRNYGVGAQILIDLGVRNMILLRGTQTRPAALAGYGLSIERSISWSDLGYADGDDT
jgi:3,4-dihydroxy 2-butanone 4-phosphate synthase/GTP cyclohydrolase II